MLIPNILKAAPKYIFNKLIYSHDLAVTMRSYSALNIKLDEAFKTALQTNSYKTAKLLLSSDKLDLNYKDSEGNSHLMNILQSQNTTILKNYFSKIGEAGVKLENSSISEAFDIALNDKKVVNIFLKGLTKLNKLDQLQTQSLDHNSPDKAGEVFATDNITSSAPPAYEVIRNSSLHSCEMLGKEMLGVHQE
jgi:hypothetical protein